MARRRGYEGVLNYKVGGFEAGGGWTPLGAVRNANLADTTGDTDATTRDDAILGFKTILPTLQEIVITFDLIADDDDAGVAAIETAKHSRSVIGLQMLSHETGQGPEGDFYITDLSRSEQLEDGQSYSVTAKLAKYSQWVS